MIEVNLLPGGRKRSGKGPKFSFSMPRIGGGGGFALPAVDRWVMGAGGAAVIALLAIGWLFMGVAGQAEELEVRIEVAERDSIRLADLIRRADGLQARRDSIAQRVGVIQQIDGSRYLWPHLLDEIGRALPDFIWLVRLFQLSPGDDPVFRVEGRAGTYFALTTFMENLEASPFIRGVRLIGSEQTMLALSGGGERLVYEFELEATRREPPPEILETIPLFGPSVANPGNGPMNGTSGNRDTSPDGVN